MLLKHMLFALIAMSQAAALCAARTQRPPEGAAAEPPRAESAHDLMLDHIRAYRSKGFGVHDHEQQERIIRIGYEALERYTRVTGKMLTFELRDFRTIHADRFDEISWEGLLTMPTERTLVVGRNTQYYPDGTVEVTFWPSWQRTTPYSEMGELEKTRGMTLAEFFEFGATDTPFLRLVKAVTTYEVTVSLDGEGRTYRALALWGPPHKDTGDFEYKILDHVTQRAGEIVGEKAPFLKELHKDRLKDRSKEGGDLGRVRASSGTSTICVGEQNHQQFFQAQDGAGHVTGQHGVHGEADFTCSCEFNCSQTLESETSFQLCSEAGTVGNERCHVPSPPSFVGRSGFSTSGTSSPASGDVTVACAFTDCDGCSCNPPNVSVSIQGVGVSVQASPNASWTMSQTQPFTCKTCVRMAPGHDVDDGEPSQDPTAHPLVINTGGQGFRFTDLVNGVLFNIDGGSDIEKVSWTAPGSGDAFLVLDRNGNGVVDDGLELFGDRTAQPASPEPNGYKALALFDMWIYGGDEDGVITAADEVFERLRLWIDDSHDGISQPEELLPLSAFDVERIALDHVRSERRDRHGNRIKYASKVHQSGGRHLQSVAVFFFEQEQLPR